MKAISLCSFAVLIAFAFINRDSPFRCEHWALIYAFEYNSFWDAVREVSAFRCGPKTFDLRFQPLAFFIPLTSYVIFGLNFFWHLIVSIILHVFVCRAAMSILDALSSGNRSQRALEFSLMLIAYPAIDTLGWTFFQYIQVALLLGLLSIYYLLKDRIILSSCLALLACLIYEAFYPILPIIALWNWRKRSVWVPATFSALILAVYLKIYSSMAVSWLAETGYILESIVLGFSQMVLVTITHLAMIPKPINTAQYYMRIPESQLWNLLFWSAIPFLIYYLRKEKKALLVMASGFLVFSMITYGRASPLYASIKFRYVYVALPFLMISGFYLVRGIKYSGVAIFALIIINLIGVIRYSYQAEKGVRNFGQWVKGKTIHEITEVLATRRTPANWPASERFRAACEAGCIFKYRQRLQLRSLGYL